MYHPGKVLSVFSPRDADVVSSDTGTQATLSMWDGNLITVLVHRNLADELKKDDVVLVDYRPMSTTLPVPKMVVTKILKGEHATETWKRYEERRKALKVGPSMPMSLPGTPPPHSYIG
jgi:hypothetical protein